MRHITEQDGRYITHGAHYKTGWEIYYTWGTLLNKTGEILHMGHITEQDRRDILHMRHITEQDGRDITHGAHY